MAGTNETGVLNEMVKKGPFECFPCELIEAAMVDKLLAMTI